VIIDFLAEINLPSEVDDERNLWEGWQNRIRLLLTLPILDQMANKCIHALIFELRACFMTYPYLNALDLTLSTFLIRVFNLVIINLTNNVA
jgi:hypothetical protein